MKHVTSLLFAAALALAGASAAQAFTFEGAASGDAGGATRSYVDPVDKYEPKSGGDARFDGDSKSGGQGEGFHLQFGGQRSFDQRYNQNDLFDPLKR